MSTLVRLRSLLVPACIGIVLAIMAGSYYFFWLPSQYRYLDDHNFRVLKMLSEQIRLSINVFDQMLDHAADSGISHKNLKDYLHNVAPQLESPEVNEIRSVIPDDNDNDYSDPPRMAVTADEGTHFLYLAFKRASNRRETKYAVRADLDRLVGKLLPPANRNPFDLVLVAQDDGTIIFQRSSPDTEVARIGTLEDAPAATKIGKPAPDEAQNEDATGTASERAEKKLPQASWFSEVTLAGARYRLYSQPLQLSFPPIDPTRRPGKENTATSPAEQWILCGLVRADHFKSQSQSMPYTYILWGLAAILVAAATYPFFRLQVSSAAERLRARDVLSMAVLTCFSAVALTFIVLDLYYVRNEFAQLGNEQTEQEMKKLAVDIDKSFRTEQDRAFGQLEYFSQRPDLIADLKMSKAHMGTLPKTTDGRNCNPIWACRTRILNPEGPFGKNRVDQYPYLQFVSWSDSEGNQQVKWTTKETVTPFINLSKASYYTDVQRAITEIKRARADPGYAISVPTRGTGSQYSSNTGKNITIFWELVGEDGKPFRGPGDAKNVFCASLVTHPISVVDPILPGGFQFAVIRRDGTVVFHSDSSRNLRENFFDETDQNQDLRSRLLMHADGQLMINYMGRRHRMYTHSPSAGQNDFWSVIVFRDTHLEETLNLEVLSLASVMFLVYAAAMAFILLFVHWMRIGSGRGVWLWPDSRNGVTYRWLVITNSLAALLLFLLPQLRSKIVLFAGAILIPLVVMIMNFVLLRRQTNHESSTDAGNRTAPSRWQISYVGACTTLLLVIAVLPCLSFFKVACDFEHKLFVGRSQLGLDDAVDDRARLVRGRYDLVDLGNYADLLLAGPDTPHSSSPPAMTAPVLDKFCGVAGEICFSYQATLATRICSGETCEPKKEEGPALGSSAPNRWQHLAESLLTNLSPTYNDIAADNHYLAEAGSSAEWSWSSTPIGNDERLELIRKGVGNSPRTFVSVWTPLRIPWTERRWGLGMVAFVGALFWLVRFSLRRIFLLNLLDDPKGPEDRDMLDPASLTAKPPKHLLIISPGSSHTVADLSKQPQMQAWNFQDLLQVTHESARTADGSTVVMPTGNRVDDILHDGRPLVLYNIDDVLADPDTSEKSRKELERVIGELGNSVVVTTTMDPVSKSPGEESEKWGRMLQSFVRVDLGSSPVDKPVQLECTDPYHRWLFSRCSKAEKLLLVQLAEEGLINPNSRCTVEKLIQKGLIVWRWGLLTIKDDRFADFVQRAIPPVTIKQWEKKGAADRSAWLRWSFLFIGAAVFGFLIYTQGEALNTWVTYATGLAASVPVFLHLLDILRGGKGVEP